MDSKAGIGVLLIVTGFTVIVGSITGNEAPMLAALFQPDLLVTKSGSKAVGGSGAGNAIVNGIINSYRSVGRFVS